MAVLIRNIPFLIRTAFTGRRKAEQLLLAARNNPMFGDRSHYRARIDTDLGLLYKLCKRNGEASERFALARPLAERLGESALLAKINAAGGVGAGATP